MKPCGLRHESSTFFCTRIGVRDARADPDESRELLLAVCANADNRGPHRRAVSRAPHAAAMGTKSDAQFQARPERCPTGSNWHREQPLPQLPGKAASEFLQVSL